MTDYGFEAKFCELQDDFFEEITLEKLLIFLVSLQLVSCGEDGFDADSSGFSGSDDSRQEDKRETSDPKVLEDQNLNVESQTVAKADGLVGVADGYLSMPPTCKVRVNGVSGNQVFKNQEAEIEIVSFGEPVDKGAGLVEVTLLHKFKRTYTAEAVTKISGKVIGPNGEAT